MLRTRPAFGFNFSPDDDLPGFRVDPLDGVPGFRIDQPDIPDSGYGAYGTTNANPFAPSPIPSTDPSFSRNPFSSLFAGNLYSSWPVPPSADASLVPIADVPSASSAVPSGYDPYAGTSQLTAPTVFGLLGRFAAVGNPLGAIPAAGDGTTSGAGEGLTPARYAPDDEEPNQYGPDQAQALPPRPRPPTQFNWSAGDAAVLPDGSTVPDTGSIYGHIRSPVADLSPVAAEGRRIGSLYREMLRNPQTSAGALAYLAMMLKVNLDHGGRFDYQRQRNETGDFTHFPRFEQVSNFNVGLLAQQAGLTLEQILSIAGRFSRNYSSSSDENQLHGLSPLQLKFITMGYKIGQSGAYDPPSTRLGYPL